MESDHFIPRNILDNVDLAALKTRMEKADWHYDYTEDPHVWDRGRVEINGIKEELIQLSKLEGGIQVANYLWDAHVPVHSVNRPEFLEVKNILLPQKSTTMEQKNLNFLKDTLKYHGFGEKLFTELEAKIKMVEKDFTLSISTDMKDDKISATLHFRKSKDTDAYFFNKFDAVLIKPGVEPREHTFYLDKGKGFTMKEAYNLLDGRAVHKEFTNSEGEKYKAWKQLDFDNKDEKGKFEVKTFGERYGFDLREALSYYPIREFMKADDSLNLVKSLERGNLHTISMDKDGQKMDLIITADPKNRSLVITDKEGRELSKTEKEELMLSPEARENRIEQKVQLNAVANNKTYTNEKEPAAPVLSEPGKEKSNSKELNQAEKKAKELLPKKSQDNSLLEKKKTGAKKGMKIK